MKFFLSSYFLCFMLIYCTEVYRHDEQRTICEADKMRGWGRGRHRHAGRGYGRHEQGQRRRRRIPADRRGRPAAGHRAAVPVYLHDARGVRNPQSPDGLGLPARTGPLRYRGLGPRRKRPVGGRTLPLVLQPLQRKLRRDLPPERLRQPLQQDQSSLFLYSHGAILPDMKGEIFMAYCSGLPCGSYGRQPPTQQPGGFQMVQPLSGGLPMTQPQPGGFQTQQPQPSMPTGFPTGGTATPLLPAQTGVPAYPVTEQPPTTVQSTLFTPGFLRTQIGKKMRVEFLLSTGPLVDRTGTLLAVGASYILLRLVASDDIMMCDIYSIKFVTILL